MWKNWVIEEEQESRGKIIYISHLVKICNTVFMLYDLDRKTLLFLGVIIRFA
jgi:hypothetical protein